MARNRNNLQKIIIVIILATLNNGFDVKEETKNSMLQVLDTYFELNSSILIAYDRPGILNKHTGLYPDIKVNLRLSIISTIHELDKWTVQISTKKVTSYQEDFPAIRLTNTIIFLHERTILKEKEFSKQMKILRQNPLWGPYGKTLIVVEKSDVETDNFIWSKRVITKIWKFTRNDDMLVLIPNITTGIEFYTWFPYHPPDCSEVDTIVHLNTWVDGGFQREVDLFPEKMTNNLQGCEFVMVTTECIPYVIADDDTDLVYKDDTLTGYGIEIEIIKALSQAMNFKIKMVKHPENFWDTMSENETVGAFKLLQDQRVDLAFSCMMLNFERYYLAEPLPSYFDDSLIWFVPTPTLKSHIYDIFYAFPKQFWLFILVTLVFANIAVIFIVRIEKDFQPDQVHSSMSYVLKLIGMSVSSAVVFSTNSILLRSCIFFFCLYSLHLTTAYQASLFSRFRTSAYEDAYKSVQQAIDANLLVYLRSSTKAMYNTSDHELWNQILLPERHVFADDYTISFDKCANDKTAMTLYIKSTGLYLISYFYSTEKGLPKILYLPERFSSYPVTMYMSPGSPLFPVFENIIYRLIASGLVELWSKKAVQEKLQSRNRFRVIKNTPLSLQHLMGAFFLLFGFLFISFVIFLIEILHFKYREKERVKKKCISLSKMERDDFCKKRTEKVVQRSSWFVTKPNENSQKLNQLFYSQINAKKKKTIFF